MTSDLFDRLLDPAPMPLEMGFQRLGNGVLQVPAVPTCTAARARCSMGGSGSAAAPRTVCGYVFTGYPHADVGKDPQRAGRKVEAGPG